MTTDARVIAEISEANPVADTGSPTMQERAEADRLLGRLLDEVAAAPPRRPRPRLGLLVPVASLLIVVAVAAVILQTGGSSTRGSAAHGATQIVLTAQPTPQTPRITASAMSREIALLRRRLTSLGNGYTVAQSGAHGIIVTLPRGRAAERARVVRLVTQTARLLFYDWEANVLTPNGRTAASQLLAQDRAAILVSQGGSQPAGSAGAGSMSLYDAVKLASKQPRAKAGPSLSRLGPEYYVFGAPGSAACADAAAAGHTQPTVGTHCLLAGPLDLGKDAGPHQAVEEAAARYPSGVIPGRAEVVAVPQGTVVLQAAQVNAAAPVTLSDRSAQFFVLRDRVAFTGNDITRPQASADQAGQPDVTFGFTGAGQAAFQRVTEAVSRRAASVSLSGATLYQHFAVALDNQLITVPQIDFRVYPHGIIGGGGADVASGFTPQSAKDLAIELRDGALPLAVRVSR